MAAARRCDAPAATAAGVVHACPPLGTYWRSSSQIGQAGGGAAASGKEVPQVAQRWTVIALLPVSAPRRIGVEGRAPAR